MNRRDLLKFLPASVVGAIAVPALAKVRPKPEFPRYFVHTQKTTPRVLYNVAESADVVWAVMATGDRERWWRERRKGDRLELATIKTCEMRVAMGGWREITAAEAEALLKPKPGFPRYFAKPNPDGYLINQGPVVYEYRSPSQVFGLHLDPPRQLFKAIPLADCERYAWLGMWREITATEAEVLVEIRASKACQSLSDLDQILKMHTADHKRLNRDPRQGRTQ